MRIITFQCDMCGYEKTLYLNCGMQVPRILWTYGRFEICDICSDKAKDWLQQEMNKNKGNKNDH